ncbi:MAG: C-GCAxxG-C-C family protein [bacterium]|nr:C-GCAxxG-C-C family protein [bacterium]
MVLNQYEKKARELFLNGCNCSQAVFCAFCDVTGIDEKVALKISSSFGGGMGRLREVCGAVSGMFMVLGALYGYDDVGDGAAKSKHYKRIQKVAEEFKKENGSIVCRELLGDGGKDCSPVASARTDEYYKKRPCVELVALAARITAQYIEQNKIEKQ